MVEINRLEGCHFHRGQVQHAADILRNGGVIVYPTDTIYGMAADVENREAVERIFKIKRVSRQKLLSLVFADFDDIARWAKIPTHAYRVMKRVLPGKYTFILPASKEVPRSLIKLQKRKTVGVRIPDSDVARALATALGRPLLSTSVPKGSDDFFSDPNEIAEQYRYDLDLIIDCGLTPTIPSTVVDFSLNPPEVLREGAGDVAALF